MSSKLKAKPRKKRPSLESMAAEIDAIAVGAREYHESEDCSEAEYCQTLGYGDGKDEVESRIKDLDEEVRAKVEAMRAADPDKFFENLPSVCDLSLEGYRCIANEIFSVHLGEVEEQLDGEIRDQVMALTPARREALRKLVSEAYLGKGDCIYLGMDSSRWVMSLDIETLDTWLKRRSIVPKAKAEAPNVLLTETPEVRRAAFRLIMGGAA